MAMRWYVVHAYSGFENRVKQSLIERVQVLAARQHDQIFINTQGLDDAIPVALEMVRNGVETIISRRGTAHLLRENLRIPVLSFPHRSLDILVSLKQAAGIVDDTDVV